MFIIFKPFILNDDNVAERTLDLVFAMLTFEADRKDSLLTNNKNGY